MLLQTVSTHEAKKQNTLIRTNTYKIHVTFDTKTKPQFLKNPPKQKHSSNIICSIAIYNKQKRKPKPNHSFTSSFSLTTSQLHLL